MTKHHWFALALLLPLVAPAAAQTADADAVKRGEYLVMGMGCNDCHTPFVMGTNGPEPDMTRALSGHPQDLPITQPAALAEPWAAASSMTNTAHSGPWGVS